ncbi:MAG: NAD-dependent epimerase/dehydratase family protein [Methylobacter sp.]
MVRKINNMPENRILITGTNGFLGQAILSRLQAAGFFVLATDLGDVCCSLNIPYRKADIVQPAELKPIVENITTVIHAAGLAHVFTPAASTGEKFHKINEIGTKNIAAAAAAAGVRHFVLISSVSVYGPYTDEAYDEKRSCKPVGPYALSKYNAELRATEIAKKSGMPLTILRLATLYGEGDPGNVGRLIRAIDRGRFFWVGNGSNRKSLLYKGDAARAVMAVVQRPASCVNIFNISAPPCTMREIVDCIGDALGKHPFPVRLPASLALLLGRCLSKMPNRRLAGLNQTVTKWLADDVYDSQRFEEAYGFQTKTSLQDGLKREVDWYKKIKF